MKLQSVTMPFLRQPRTTKNIMNELFIGLLIISIYSIFYNFFNNGFDYGVKAISIHLLAIFCSCLLEYIYYQYFMKEPGIEKVKNSHPWITALIFTCTIPIGTPLYVVIIGCLISVIFAKLLFGGIGYNIFNPALVGRAIIGLAFAGVITPNLTGDLISGATPLSNLANEGWLFFTNGKYNHFFNTVGDITKMFLGDYAGALGETNTLLILIIGIFLCYRRVCDYVIPLFYLLTVSIIICLVSIYFNYDIRYLLFHLFSGGLAFGAFFTATDPVTSPKNKFGKIIFAIILGFLTVLIRFKTNWPEGVYFSILLANILAVSFDRYVGNKLKEFSYRFMQISILMMILVFTNFFLIISIEKPEEVFNNIRYILDERL